MSISYHDYPILYVDDESPNLVSFRYTMEGRFRVFTASSGKEALRILKEQDIAVLMADQRMPEMTGVEVCVKAKELRPSAVRIIVTAYADLQAAIEAINRGQVLRYLTKPWRVEELIDVLRTCIEIVHLQRTVREMEVRLLQSGPSTTLLAVQQELAYQFEQPLASLLVSAQLVSDLITSSLASLDTYDREHLRRLLGNAREAQRSSLSAIFDIQSMVNRLRQGRQPSPGGPPAVCDATRVIDSTVRILRQEIEKDARLQVVLEGSPTVGMDGSALGQVMLNVLMNAVQAVGETKSESNLISVRVQEGLEEAAIEVSDNGPGIAPQHLERVFDPYFTTKESSTGIGLSVVQELVRRASGRVMLESSLGKGTTVKITLPYAVPVERS